MQQISLWFFFYLVEFIAEHAIFFWVVHSFCCEPVTHLVRKNTVQITLHISFFHCSMQLQCKYYARPKPLYKCGGYLLKFTVYVFELFVTSLTFVLPILWIMLWSVRSRVDRVQLKRKTYTREIVSVESKAKGMPMKNKKSASTPYPTTDSSIKYRILMHARSLYFCLCEKYEI